MHLVRDIVPVARRLEALRGEPRFRAQELWCEDEKAGGLHNSIFDPAREVAVVRPLCEALGYFKPADISGIDMLHSTFTAAQALAIEGSVGALELLHPCTEQPDITKYQALFRMEPRFSRYREAFFMNTAYGGQSGSREQMLDVLEALAVRCKELGEVENALLLSAGREAVASRYQCFGVLQHPESCTLDSAWLVFRRAIRRREFWLSFQELQLVGALHQTWVRVFTPGGAEGGQRYFEELQCSRLHRGADASGIVKVVLDTHGRQGDARGHFSRLFAEPE